MNAPLEKIKEEISANNVVLYMKGTSSMPQCGFSSRIAGSFAVKLLSNASLLKSKVEFCSTLK